MLRRRPRLIPRLRALLGPDTAAARQNLVALSLNSSTSLVAGAVLSSITATFAKFPGLLVLVPAAIGLRGNIFGSFGNRISTTIHAGTFRMSTRPETVLGQNVLAASALTLVVSVVLAVLAKAVGVALGLSDTVSILTLVVISVIGGVLASVVVLAATLGLSGGAVRWWDLDNVSSRWSPPSATSSRCRPVGGDVRRRAGAGHLVAGAGVPGRGGGRLRRDDPVAPGGAAADRALSPSPC